MKYRKKPVVIEAVQYRSGEQDSVFAQDVIDGNHHGRGNQNSPIAVK